MSTDQTKRRGYWLGLFFALSSPWNIGFWFAVIGSQTTQILGLQRSLALAAAVTWTLVLCAALKLGARIFSRPEWQIMTEALTCLVMLFFAARLVLHFRDIIGRLCETAPYKRRLTQMPYKTHPQMFATNPESARRADATAPMLRHTHRGTNVYSQCPDRKKH